MQARFKHAVLFSVKLPLSIAVLVYIARGLGLLRLRAHLVSVNSFLFIPAGAANVIVGLAGGVIWLASPERGSYSADKAAQAADESPDYELAKVREVSSHP
ncbi:hypothetical protein A5906_39395 [Bradyrhizobium sacchari]|uniref:Uncharacterized protein n=1 Tax=Bradyrhizobium sacchari TaxID=1399419 RepID=A0A560K5F9_9BRAD|nr:hypothetical protein [Bradyrhizobium sacchari]OPY97476.1 hypothetical protein A5906_39395 [Bradyrhizobium sacchari]TWB54130.1 hypothetical protein FBZ94_108422 [Bradyrhizobium sacchari]TWB78578.1 hypothetical protein FBZ95_103422 [Bradyrhizobium sacchari]